MVPLQSQKRKRKKREVFLTTRCCARCLCVRTLLQPVDTGLCVTSLLCVRTLLQPVDTGLCVTSLLCVRTLLQPVDTGLCVTSSVSGPCYSLWIQVFVLPHSSVITTKNNQHVLTLCALWV